MNRPNGQQLGLLVLVPTCTKHGRIEHYNIGDILLLYNLATDFACGGVNLAPQWFQITVSIFRKLRLWSTLY